MPISPRGVLDRVGPDVEAELHVDRVVGLRVARTRFIRPPYVLSYVLVSIGPYFGSLNFSGLDVYDVPSGETPRLSAAMRPMILNVEPGWRRPCAARLNFVCA